MSLARVPHVPVRRLRPLVVMAISLFPTNDRVAIADEDDVILRWLLATLFAPELVEDYGLKQATVALDRERIALANRLEAVAQAEVRAAAAHQKAARLAMGKRQPEVDHLSTEATRLKEQPYRGQGDARAHAEAREQLKASTAAREKAQEIADKANAELLRGQAALAKAQADVRIAQADHKVAESEVRRLQAWLGYLRLSAPFDGVIVARNANTFDFVKPEPGATPIYVVDRTDIVRVFVDAPEQHANHVRTGNCATVLVPAYSQEPFEGTITRTSWALNVKGRQLRAEIDLANPKSQLRPGMYAFAKIFSERSGVRALPPCHDQERRANLHVGL